MSMILDLWLGSLICAALVYAGGNHLAGWGIGILATGFVIYGATRCDKQSQADGLPDETE